MTISTKDPAERTSVPPARTAGAVTTPTAYKDALRIPPILHPVRLGNVSIANVNMRAVTTRLHSELPATQVWAYDGVFPGPTIVVRKGERVRVTWTNQLDGAYPVTAVEAPVQLLLAPGASGAPANAKVAKLPPWTTVHLHGARTGADNDGWPENGVSLGDSQLSEYPNDQEATTLWYHDHAMAITRYNVVTGLVGMYLIRDDQEDALQLPRGPYEVPLILMDRNLETAADGSLTGRLLHKIGTIPGDPKAKPPKPGLTTPYFGPFNLVNGIITPHLDVASRWYRFRVLNASNARVYKLHVCDEKNQKLRGVMRQIGSDGGLLPAPLAIDELVLAPAERADILIDFEAFRGRELQLRNFGDVRIPPSGTDIGDPVMELRVSRFPVIDPFKLPSKLSKTYERYGHNNGTIPADHEHRWIVLTPVSIGHPELWEMEEVKHAHGLSGQEGIVQVIDVKKDAAGRELSREKITLRRVARRFGENLTIRVEHGAFEIWNIIHLGSNDPAIVPPNPMHPLHIHLIEFQALDRVNGAVLDSNKEEVFDRVRKSTRHPIEFIHQTPDQGLDANETGWKDVIRVEPGTWVRVAGKFEGAHGRFVYHCHILDHEDMGMMRPFTVMPAEVAALDIEHTDHHHDDE